MLGYKRSHESGSGGPERKIQKGSEHRVPKRALSSNYKTNSNLPRPRSGERAEFQPTIERKTQQGGPVRSRKGRGRNDIEERTRSNNKNVRRGGDQQRQDQESKGACTKKSLSLEVLVGNANYKS
ncbi:uncharacterized protein TNCV_1387761 [Trichonephila clavipes]|nr:uncharacterized protein TNCV_1387761 [Trichonephila clavipes]